MASSEIIVVDVPDFASCLKILRNRPARSRIRNDLVRLNSLLDSLQITLELRVKGICVAIVGSKMDAPIENLFGFKQLKLFPLAIVKSAIKKGKSSVHDSSDRKQ